ncbi:MAG: hypothetical protein AB7K24_10280 [Gemmataceae bacterium]
MHRIESIEFIGGFLDNLRFEFAPGFNCVIGGRGTGKTTLVELLRWTLAALPEEANERRRIESLVKHNLDDGRVQVTVETREGLRYTISRIAGEEPTVVAADENPSGKLRPSGVFRADFFSQSEIEGIADRVASQLRLVDSFAADEIAKLEAGIKALVAAVRTNASQVAPLVEQSLALDEDLANLPTVEEKLKASSISGGDKKAIDRAQAEKGLRESERLAVASMTENLDHLSRGIGECEGQIKQQTELLFAPEIVDGPNGKLVSLLREKLLACAREVDQHIQEAKQKIATTRGHMEATDTKLSQAHAKQEVAFRELVEKHRIVQKELAERTRLETLRAELVAKQHQRKQIGTKLNKALAQRRDLLDRLSEARNQLFAIRQRIAKTLNKQLGPTIRVDVRQAGNPEPYRNHLEEVFKNARMRSGLVTEKLVNAFGPFDLADTIRSRDERSLMEKAGINRDQASKVMAALMDADRLLELEVAEMIDEPIIQLKDGDDYKDLANLSKGQKCTAIMPFLLLENDNPLIVDQPEDQLDNRFICETIVTAILASKKRRQLIFVSHVANIPVLGDAKQIYVLESNGESARI